MASASEDHYFDLFGLRRELRDTIYDEVLSDAVTALAKGMENPLAFTVKHAMTLSLSLVSRQFREECGQRQRQVCLLVTENAGWDNSMAAKLPSMPARIQEVEMYMEICIDGPWCHTPGDRDCECDIHSEFDFHHETAAEVLHQLPEATKLSMNLYFQQTAHLASHLDGVREHFEDLTNIHKLLEVRIHHCFRRQVQWNIAMPSELVSRWSPETGLQRALTEQGTSVAQQQAEAAVAADV